MIRFAVFDLDGTLVDSRRDLADAANMLIGTLGGEPLSEEVVTGMVGEGASILVRRVLAAAGLDPDSPGALEQFLEFYDERLLEHTRPYDGTEAMLIALSARMPLAVLTNKPQAHTERVLHGLGLCRFFQDVIGGDTPFGRKPDPGGLSELARRAGVPLAATALIGDSPIDLETARRAGSQAVLVSYGFGYHGDELRDGERVASSPAALTTLL